MRKPSYRLTRAADSALDDIFRRGVAEDSLRQAQDDLVALHEVFGMFASFLAAGRDFHAFRRHEPGSHIIFYEAEGEAMVISDVLNAERDFEVWRSMGR